MQDLLEKERAELKETRKQVSNMSEDLKIAEERTQHALAEREKFSERSKEFIHRINTIQDQIKDKDI